MKNPESLKNRADHEAESQTESPRSPNPPRGDAFFIEEIDVDFAESMLTMRC